MNKIKKIWKMLESPGYAIYKVASRVARISLRSKVFAHAKEYRSDSEDGRYASAVLNALKNQNNFDNFKRSYSYREILEHVSEEHGEQYLRILEARNDGIIEKAISTVLKTDDVGNPIKFNYRNFTIPLSPTTLRYVKVASDLNIIFGEDLGDVAEIGCGYGGQTLVNDQLLNVRSATLFDLPFVNSLIKRYLNTHLLKGAYDATVINRRTPSRYDLVISNYAFSELPKKLQKMYIHKVLSNSKKGYLTMNTGMGDDRSSGKLSIAELKELLPEFSIISEEPLTANQNYIIVWGYNKDRLSDNFQIIE